MSEIFVWVKGFFDLLIAIAEFSIICLAVLIFIFMIVSLFIEIIDYLISRGK